MVITNTSNSNMAMPMMAHHYHTVHTLTTNDNGPIHHQHNDDGSPITTPVNSPHPLPVP